MAHFDRTGFDLTDKVAIITGASKGIGAAMAYGLANFGARVVVSSRSQDAVDTVATDIQARGGTATGIACHVGESAQLQRLFDHTIDTYGGVDILINNAATNPVYGPLDQTDGAVFDKIMGVNVRAAHLLANLCFPSMRERGGGSVINVASVEGYAPSKGLGLYSVSKAALIMLSRAQGKEWGGAGIRSNALCPGLVKTKFSAALWQNDQIMQVVKGHLPAGRAATPEEMVGLTVFLASDASSYCTGQTFVADGGHLLGF